MKLSVISLLMPLLLLGCNHRDSHHAYPVYPNSTRANCKLYIPVSYHRVKRKLLIEAFEYTASTFASDMGGLKALKKPVRCYISKDKLRVLHSRHTHGNYPEGYYNVDHRKIVLVPGKHYELPQLYHYQFHAHRAANKDHPGWDWRLALQRNKDLAQDIRDKRTP